MLSRVAVFHHPQSEGAVAFAAELSREFERRDVQVTVANVWADDAGACIAGVDLVLCIGGDGTVLRAARIGVGCGVPILGINMGRLGFLTDMSPRDTFNQFERIMARDWQIDERIMVRADFLDRPDGESLALHGLNDIVVSRQSPGRPIYVDLFIDHTRLARYRCDGMIVATPTGSTGYSLSAGGPILVPTEHHLVVTPVSAHLALGRSLVLPPDVEVEMLITSDHGAVLSVDGQDDIPISSGASVRVSLSEHKTRFVRFRDATSFYADLAEKLDLQLSSVMGSRA
jgi:NAD+ kinase